MWSKTSLFLFNKLGAFLEDLCSLYLNKQSSANGRNPVTRSCARIIFPRMTKEWKVNKGSFINEKLKYKGDEVIAKFKRLYLNVPDDIYNQPVL